MSKQTNKQLRDNLFDNPESKPNTEIFEYNGVRYECREPSMGTILKWGDEPEVVDILIDQVYNPDTGEKVFDRSMKDSLLNLPPGHPVFQMVQVIGGLAAGNLDIDLEEPGGDEGNGQDAPLEVVEE